MAIDFPLGIVGRTKINWLMSINNYESLTTIKDINEKFSELKSHIDFTPVYFAYRKKPNSITNNLGNTHYPDYSSGTPKNEGFTFDPSEECLHNKTDFCVRRLDGRAIGTSGSSPL